MTATPPPPTPVPPDPLVAARLSRRRWAWTLLWCLIIFASGAATGWGVSRLLGRRHPPEVFRPDPPVADIVGRMARDLALSDAQVREITEVYHRRGAALQAIRREMAPRFEAEYGKLRDELKRILTPEQFAQWEPRFEETRRRMLPPPPRGRQFGPPGGPEGGPPPFGPRPGGPDGGPPPFGPRPAGPEGGPPGGGPGPASRP